MKLAVATLATLLAGASAMPKHRGLFGSSAPQVAAKVHHINTTITPHRCGETTVVGNAATFQYIYSFMGDNTTFSVSKGTCLSAGYAVKAGPQDMSNTQRWHSTDRYKTSSFGYYIDFYHKSGVALPTTVGAAQTTVVGLGVATPTLSTLVAALKAGGLVGALSAKGPFTVFAPTNAAFAELGAAVPQLLEPQNKALLVKLLEYHVIAGRAIYSPSAPVTAGQRPYLMWTDQQVASLEGQDLSLTIPRVTSCCRWKLNVNGVLAANIQKRTRYDKPSDVLAINGVVYVIDKVLLFPGFQAALAALSAPAPVAGTGGKGGKGAKVCSDNVSFRDSYGTCQTYEVNNWCAYGAVGPAWQKAWGGLSSAVQAACCACGGSGFAAAVGTGPLTVVGVAVATPTLSTLVTAVKAAGLVSTLSGPGPFTVFAPTNAAFAKIQPVVTKLLKPEFRVGTGISAANKALLARLLKYHVLASKVLSSAITNGQSVATVEGQKLCFEVDSRTNVIGMYACADPNSAATVSQANVLASNGVVHLINQVLMPPGFAALVASR